MTSEPDASDPAAWEEHLYKILAAAAVALLATGTVTYRILEDWSWVDSFYFSAVAVTTVGFGDLTPTRDVSKLFTVGYIFTGAAIITAFLTARLQRRGRKRSRPSK